MTKLLKLKISTIISFKSCRPKNPSDLPFNPVPSFSFRRPPPPLTPSTTVPQRHRSSFREHVVTAFGCRSSRRRSSTPSPTFQLESQEKWHVVALVNEGEYETPRRKIYMGRLDIERYVRRRESTSSAEEYDEEAERESLLASSTMAEVLVEGVAVVKRSEDPYEDFKGSMVEMIVEKKMVQVAELEQLLCCFLTLNAKRHHRAIVKAFSEVWVALFVDDNDSSSSRRSSVRLSDYD